MDVFNKDWIDKAILPMWKFWLYSLMFWKYQIIELDGKVIALLKK